MFFSLFCVCRTCEGYPKPEITWTKDGEAIKRHLGSAKQQKWSLEFEEATTYDSGNYTCTVSNPHGTISFTFKLLIQGNNLVVVGPLSLDGVSCVFFRPPPPPPRIGREAKRLPLEVYPLVIPSDHLERQYSFEKSAADVDIHYWQQFNGM